MKEIQGITQAEQLTDDYAVVGKLRLNLDETVVPVAIISDRSLDNLGRPAGGSIDVAAGGAGFRSQAQLSLPGGAGTQGTYLYVERVLIYSGVNAFIQVGRSGGLPAPNLTGDKHWRDSGLQGFPQALLQGKNNAAAAAGFQNVFRMRALANTTYDIRLDWIIRAGDSNGILVRPAVDNEQLNVGFVWRERRPR